MKKLATAALVAALLTIPTTANATVRKPAPKPTPAVQIVAASQECINGNDLVTVTIRNNTAAVFYADVYHSSEFTQNRPLMDTWVDVAAGDTAVVTFNPGYPSNLDIVVADDVAWPSVRVVASRELAAPDCVHSW